MMKFIQTAPTAGDCTAPYDVELDKPYTIGELVDEILTKGEWGYIYFHGLRFEYKRDKISPEYIPAALRRYPVVEVKAAGGWSRMDYFLK